MNAGPKKLKLTFVNQQTIEVDGIIGIKQEEANTTVVKYANHTTRLHGVSAGEVIAKVNAAKADSR